MTIYTGRESTDSSHGSGDVQITSFPTCNQMFVKDKFLGDNVFYTLEQFCKINEYNEIGFLLITFRESRRSKGAQDFTFTV